MRIKNIILKAQQWNLFQDFCKNSQIFCCTCNTAFSVDFNARRGSEISNEKFKLPSDIQTEENIFQCSVFITYHVEPNKRYILQQSSITRSHASLTPLGSIPAKSLRDIGIRLRSTLGRCWEASTESSGIDRRNTTRCNSNVTARVNLITGGIVIL